METALDRLRLALQRIAPSGEFAEAYSGGLDSRFLAHAALLLGFRPRLLHVTGVHIGEDRETVVGWASRQGLECRVVEFDPLSVPEVASGSKYRCYGCKKAIFSVLKEMAQGLPLCDGTNHSDLDAGQWRPGVRALKELGIASPLAEAGLGKPEIRAIARETGMERPDQKPEPCLLTRLPYGVSPQAEVLVKLREGERAVRKVLCAAGLKEPACRIRLVAGGRPELHFPRETWDAMTPALREAVESSVRRTAPVFFTALQLRVLEKLSGYYDRTPGQA